MAKKAAGSPPGEPAGPDRADDPIVDAIELLARLRGWYAPRMIYRLEFLRWLYEHRDARDMPEFREAPPPRADA